MAGLDKQRARWLATEILPHEGPLRAWLGRKIGRQFDVDDIIQESYAKLATLDSVDHIRNPRAYLFRVAGSIVLQEARRARVVPIDIMPDLEQLELAALQPLQDEVAEMREELQRVGKAIESLPEKCREVFKLRRIYGLSQKEIAQKLQISEKTVENHVSRGIRQIGKLLADEGMEPAQASLSVAGTEGCNGRERQELWN